MTRLLHGRKARLGAAAAAMVLGTAGLTVTWPEPTGDRVRTADVRVGAFVETLIERGTVSAARLMLYGSTIAGAQAKLLEMVPEGREVAAGDVLFRFDPAPFEDAVKREDAALTQAEADAIRAREELRLEELRADTDTEVAREQVDAAESAYTAERDGRGPVQLAEAEIVANDAARELQRARTADADLRALLAQGFVTRGEVERGEQALRQAEDRQRLATLRLDALRRHDQPAATSKARTAVTVTRKTLDATTQAGRSRLIQRRAAVTLTESRVAEARLRLERARDQLGRTTVTSSSAGLVVYRELFFGTDKRKPQPGDEVWPNQPLVAIPDPAQLVVETRVRETDLHRIAATRAVTVTVDAYPELKLAASVTMIGALAESDPGRAGTRFFPVAIKLTAGDSRLRTGMTARVELEVARADQALLVPVEALVEDDGTTRCQVLTRHGIESRVVDVIARNAFVANIASGVAAGDRVVIGDRAAVAAAAAR